MDPALKKRLIGASVLIVLAIIFLPMLFDGADPAPGGSVQQLDIPLPPQRDFETRVVPLEPAMPTTGVAEAIGLPATGVAPNGDSAQLDPDLSDAPVLVDDPIAAVAAPVAARVDAVSGDVVSNDSAPTTQAPAAQAPTITPSPSGSPVTTNNPSASAGSAASEVKAPVVAVATSAAAGAGRFMVNIGSYANAANAGQLESGLRAAGLTVRSESVMVDSKPARRLRLGPYASRALAESARIKAKSVRADIPASVIEVDDSPATDAPPRSSARTGASAFAVQVAVLSDASKANAQRDTLRGAGFAAFVEKLDTEKGSVYRVRVGPEADRADAEKIRSAVKQRFGHDAIIVDYP